MERRKEGIRVAETVRRLTTGPVPSSELPCAVHELLRFINGFGVVQRRDKVWILLKEELRLTGWRKITLRCESLISRTAPRHDTASGSRLTTNALDLVSTMLHAELSMTPDRMKPQALLATSVREYIEAHLSDPALSPASIAAAHFISTRHLHNVFHESGATVSGWIRSQRLERTRRDLRDPLHAGDSVGTVAARWGFLDAAHFSRTFRDAFGQSPSDWRRGA